MTGVTRRVPKPTENKKEREQTSVRSFSDYYIVSCGFIPNGSTYNDSMCGVG